MMPWKECRFGHHLLGSRIYHMTFAHHYGGVAKLMCIINQVFLEMHLQLIPNPAIEKSRFVREGRRTVVV
jgi:hypothetical protein